MHTDGGPIVFSAKDHTEFTEAFYRIGRDLDNKVIILTGKGDWMAQIDAESFLNNPDPYAGIKIHDEGVQILENLLNIRVPVIAAIEGKAHIAYIPNGKIVGLSKLPRVVDIFARRLQVQERLTDQIVNTINRVLKPEGCAVVIEASHMCMMMRGVQKQNSVTTTSAFRGTFKIMETRNEFLKLISSKLS